MAVAWPTVKDRLVALIPTLTPAPEVVFDGPVPTGEQPLTVAMVGWQLGAQDAGSYNQTRTGPEGFAAEESGTVLLEYRAASGGTDMPDAFDMVDALQRAVQNDQSLGVLTGAPTVSLDVTVVEAQTRDGALQRLLVSLNYTTHVTP